MNGITLIFNRRNKSGKMYCTIDRLQNQAFVLFDRKSLVLFAFYKVNVNTTILSVICLQAYLTIKLPYCPDKSNTVNRSKPGNNRFRHLDIPVFLLYPGGKV